MSDLLARKLISIPGYLLGIFLLSLRRFDRKNIQMVGFVMIALVYVVVLATMATEEAESCQQYDVLSPHASNCTSTKCMAENNGKIPKDKPEVTVDCACTCTSIKFSPLVMVLETLRLLFINATVNTTTFIIAADSGPIDFRYGFFQPPAENLAHFWGPCLTNQPSARV